MKESEPIHAQAEQNFLRFTTTVNQAKKTFAKQNSVSSSNSDNEKIDDEKIVKFVEELGIFLEPVQPHKIPKFRMTLATINYSLMV